MSAIEICNSKVSWYQEQLCSTLESMNDADRKYWFFRVRFFSNSKQWYIDLFVFSLLVAFIFKDLFRRKWKTSETILWLRINCNVRAKSTSKLVSIDIEFNHKFYELLSLVLRSMRIAHEKLCHIVIHLVSDVLQ